MRKRDNAWTPPNIFKNIWLALKCFLSENMIDINFSGQRGTWQT
jgi:hypothetical protein